MIFFFSYSKKWCDASSAWILHSSLPTCTRCTQQRNHDYLFCSKKEGRYDQTAPSACRSVRIFEFLCPLNYSTIYVPNLCAKHLINMIENDINLHYTSRDVSRAWDHSGKQNKKLCFSLFYALFHQKNHCCPSHQMNVHIFFVFIFIYCCVLHPLHKWMWFY